ncbi:MAG: hypothetical protein KGJ43_08170, partial [Acidobacteriota bacterium]|nr:hypothetical protein [Acidobacteriota bacterium]
MSTGSAASSTRRAGVAPPARAGGDGPAPAGSAHSPLGLRGDFPILSRTFAGHPLVYLDSAATSQ